MKSEIAAFKHTWWTRGGYEDLHPLSQDSLESATNERG